MHFDSDESIASASDAVALPAASFGPSKQIDAGVLNVGYAEAGPAERSAGDPAPRLAVRHPQLRRCRAAARVGRAIG